VTVRPNERPHILLGLPIYECLDTIKNNRILHTVERLGAPLLYVVELREPMTTVR